jgi:hypothetical protein
VTNTHFMLCSASGVYNTSIYFSHGTWLAITLLQNNTHSSFHSTLKDAQVYWSWTIILNLQLPMQSVPINANVESSNSVIARDTRDMIRWQSLSVTCGRSVVFSAFSGFLHRCKLSTTMQMKYFWKCTT